MTKQLYKAPAQVRITFLVQSRKNKRRFTTTETGVNSTFDAKKAVEDKRFIENARLNAIYKHMAKGGNSSAITSVVDYEIFYFTDLARVEKRKYKNGTYDVVVDARNGKVLGKTKKTYTLDVQ